MSDDLDALVNRLIAHKHWGMTEDAADAITALRAQLAEVQADRDAGAADYCALMERHDAEKVRADRAEAALAAQIEADAVAWRWESCANSQGWNTRYGCEKPAPSDYITDIVPLDKAKPHDRSALDKALAEAEARGIKRALACGGGCMEGHDCPSGPHGACCGSYGIDAADIAALLDKEGA